MVKHSNNSSVLDSRLIVYDHFVGLALKGVKVGPEPQHPHQSLKVGPKDPSSAPHSLKVGPKDPFQSLKKTPISCYFFIVLLIIFYMKRKQFSTNSL